MRAQRVLNVLSHVPSSRHRDFRAQRLSCRGHLSFFFPIRWWESLSYNQKALWVRAFGRESTFSIKKPKLWVDWLPEPVSCWHGWGLLPVGIGDDLSSLLQSGTTLAIAFFNTLKESSEDLDEVALLIHFFHPISFLLPSSVYPLPTCCLKDHSLRHLLCAISVYQERTAVWR